MPEALAQPGSHGSHERGVGKLRRLPRYRTGYSHFVHYAKLGLPAIAVGIVLLLIIWPEFHTDNRRIDLVAGDASFTVDGINRATNTRFTGVDNKNRPYSVVADSVAQMDDRAERFEFVNPRATISLSEEGPTSLAAPLGQYLHKQRSLELQGGVLMRRENAYEFRTERASINLKSGEAQVETPVTGDGEFGKINARGLTAEDNGRTLKFRGPVRLVLHPTDNSQEPAQ